MPELREVARAAATLRGNETRERWKPLRSPRSAYPFGLLEHPDRYREIFFMSRGSTANPVTTSVVKHHEISQRISVRTHVMARVRIRLHKPSAPRRPQMTSQTAPSAHGIEQRRAGAGSETRDLGGQAHAAYVSTVRALKAALQWRELEHLLLHLIEATEADARQSGCAVASVYYGELARLYRRENDRTKELEVLTRFSRLTHQAGASAARLVTRLNTLERRLASEGPAAPPANL
jgi:hypothetical protein